MRRRRPQRKVRGRRDSYAPRCIGCGQSRQLHGCAWAKVDALAQAAICTRCYASGRRERLFQKFQLRVSQARGTRTVSIEYE